jgi:putative glutamine amidotransferase
VAVDSESRLAKALGATDAQGMSHHHQAVGKLAAGLRPVAWAPDGIIEGLEFEGASWCVAVQWHPEETAQADPVQQSLFDAFVQQAALA